MPLPELKELAGRFKVVAENRSDLVKLADETIKAHPNDAAVVELCNDFKRTTDGNDVRRLAAEIAARTS